MGCSQNLPGMNFELSNEFKSLNDFDIIFVVSKAEYQWPKQIFEGAIQFWAIFLILSCAKKL